MLDKLKAIGEKAMEAVASTAVLVGDLNGDGKVDQEDARIAAEWARKQAETISDEAARLGKEVLRSDMVKDAAAGAAVGAVATAAIPFVGPMAGAVVGAGVGVFKNLGRKSDSGSASVRVSGTAPDPYAELLKLEDLRQKNIISDAEFEAEKKKILESRKL